ncbi:MAG TPA: hypothetical protein DD381_04695 [Lentisphaeria bacterium]|nr:MAG: hypothetical protein A2X47_01605 [Lentisphaerae bacterium GWF2_38_69]HBM15629.1 hypothetical protein [Lentisphaeria bacterium]
MEPLPFDDNFKGFRKSVNKFPAHLTWTRVNRNLAKLPRKKLTISYGNTILELAWYFIQIELGKGLDLDKYGKKYYTELKEILAI